MGLLSTACWLLLVLRALSLRMATSTQLFIHLTSSPNLGLTALWVLRVWKQMAQPAYCSGSEGLAHSPYSLSARPPLAWLSTHYLILSLESATGLPSRGPAYP